MIFEGSEKKFEILVDGLDLRSLPRSFWENVVQKSQAEILSSFSNDFFDAYLLSESSLFVSQNRCVMITCGQTRLIDAALFFLEQYKQNVQACFYQRKNELYPQMQSSDFTSDVEKLRCFLDGNIFELGNSRRHYTHIFYFEKETIDSNDDVTVEFLMYDISPMTRDIFMGDRSTEEKREQIHHLFSDTRLFSEFEIDDFVFEPFGYSVNGLLEDKYFTIHVTPQEECSYISFESNIDLSVFDEQLFHKLYLACQPESFDILLFQLSHLKEKTVQGKPIVDFDTTKLGQSYQVHFYHQAQKNRDISTQSAK